MNTATITPANFLSKSGIGVTTTIQVAYTTDERMGITLYRLFDGERGQSIDVYHNGPVEYSGVRRWTAEDFRSYKHAHGWRHCVVKVLAVRMKDGSLDWCYDEVIDKVKSKDVL